MRISGAWMTIWDDRILELLSRWESGTPSELAETEFVQVTSAHVGQRLKILAEHGLVRHLGNGVYIISEDGEAYLAGELDTREDIEDD